MGNDYTKIMEKYIEPTKKGLTEKGIKNIDKVVDILGEVGLNQSLELGKALIENYYLNSNLSEPIIELIEKNCIIQDCAEQHKIERD